MDEDASVPPDFLASGRLESAIRNLGVDLIGRSIGVYRITSLLGAGGMGEVYRARDTKLGRDVALKVLPHGLTSDPDRLARFDREARLLATLNHPHIAAIHGFEDASGVPALVLELVEGETLAERLARGPLPIAEALAFARQIAEALEAAHEKGIIHRDLKPANIKITAAGNVKVLDFGLAKVVQLPDPGLHASALSSEGMILGTASYMSPEQARGQAVDRQADIWAFGCVFYEMLTGRRAFAGETVSDTIAATLEREPDWSALPAGFSPTLSIFLRRCLQKNPHDRVHDIADLRLALEGAFDVTAAPVKEESRRRSLTMAISAAVLAVVGTIAALVAVGVLRTGRELDLPEVRFSIETSPMPIPFSLSVSPDGRSVVYAAEAGANGVAMLFVRRIGSVDAQVLPGTEGGTEVFWSPDSRFLGFAGMPARKLKVVDVTSGQSRILCDMPRGSQENAGFWGGAWNTDDVIVFSSDGTLYRVPAGGGVPAVLHRPNDSLNETGLRWPQFLPDGRHYIYQAANSVPANRSAVIASLDSSTFVRLMSSESNIAYAPPHFLIFTQLRTLMAQRFDASSFALMENPVPLADNILFNARGRAAFAVSRTGALIYQTGAHPRVLVWIDRTGKVGNPVGGLSQPNVVASPDLTRVAFAAPSEGVASDVFIHDLIST